MTFSNINKLDPSDNEIRLTRDLTYLLVNQGEYVAGNSYDLQVEIEPNLVVYGNLAPDMFIEVTHRGRTVFSVKEPYFGELEVKTFYRGNWLNTLMCDAPLR